MPLHIKVKRKHFKNAVKILTFRRLPRRPSSCPPPQHRSRPPRNRSRRRRPHRLRLTTPRPPTSPPRR